MFLFFFLITPTDQQRYKGSAASCSRRRFLKHVMCTYCPHNDIFLSKIIQHNVVSPISSTEYLYYDRLYRENDDILLNTLKFLHQEKREMKRKREELDDDVLQIKCYKCKKNITQRLRDGTLRQHTCFQ